MSYQFDDFDADIQSDEIIPAEYEIYLTEEFYDDSDDAFALASAGFGTDEDYSFSSDDV